MMNGVGIQCAHCGQTNDFDLFCKTNMGIELPKFHYQCPACHAAFKIEKRPVNHSTTTRHVVPTQAFL